MSTDQDFARVEQELKDARASYEAVLEELLDVQRRKLLLEADVAGLEARLKVLRPVTPVAPSADRVRGVSDADLIKSMNQTDAVKKVVSGASRPMRISDVIRELKRYGRRDNPNSVSVTLSNLANARHIERVARGVYGPLG